MLRAEGITIGTRLRDVSTAIEPACITAICGPNGAGKSTLLQVLAGLLRPEAGRVMLEGEALDTLHPRERAKAIGYLPQDAEIAWDVAVRSLVALGRLPHRDRGNAQVEAALAALDLEALAERPVSQLSGGERARALLARVIAGDPRWILADEPFAALDLAHQARLLAQLAAQAASGAGVVVVVHDLALAMNHAQRVVVLDRGRVVADSAPAAALTPDLLRAVWQVDAEWIGKPGRRALVTR
ncbi:ABC transporter ATP-binding protein [Parerythrobacter lacustris]|uniref:ABC transporter ATP-binding protein n=1 Tax=Parerythrobacter lacustris TaxID=2969984 RepID=A0ABT1XPL7_9SPHN|nr:ABC transporter ATP-binding protein [Parerythrobacter lacustris]MCR2833591.1 ABC transporter ATP-binding protein [Parerythrobacter lacustris]